MMIYPKDFILFSSTPADDEGINFAKDYIKTNNLNDDDVKLVLRGKQVLIITKKETRLKGNNVK